MIYLILAEYTLSLTYFCPSKLSSSVITRHVKRRFRYVAAYYVTLEGNELITARAGCFSNFYANDSPLEVCT